MDAYQDVELDEQIKEKLRVITDVPARDTQKAAHGKAAYIAQAHEILSDRKAVLPVSSTPFRRLIEWINQTSGGDATKRKERFNMLSALTAIMVALAMLFGGAGATVYAAQDSLPTEPLYGVKTLTEDFRVNLSVNPNRKIDIALGFAEERINEILTLRATGQPIPPDVMLRLYNHLDLALSTAATLDDTAMTAALQEIGVHIRKLDQDRVQGRTNMPEGLDPSMYQVTALLQVQAHAAELGIVDPVQFRLRWRAQSIVVTETVTDTTVPAEALGTPVAPGAGMGNIDGTPGCLECTPMYSGYGPGVGPGPMNQGATTQPTEGYGPGVGPLGTDGAGYYYVTPQAGSGSGNGPKKP